jgi:hypothetical protein
VEQSPEQIGVLLDNIAGSWTPEKVFASAFDFINQIEATALAIYEKHGLPSKDGAYWRAGPGLPWLAVAQAPSPGERWEQTDLPRNAYGHYAKIFEIGKHHQPGDTEVGFASALLFRTFEARNALRTASRYGPEGMAIGFNVGVDLTLAWTKWREEFALAGFIEPERAQRRGRSAGGRNHAERVREQRGAEWKRWRSAADGVWSKNPNLTKTAVALQVIKKLGLDVSERAVRNRIKKPEGF